MLPLIMFGPVGHVSGSNESKDNITGSHKIEEAVSWNEMEWYGYSKSIFDAQNRKEMERQKIFEAENRKELERKNKIVEAENREEMERQMILEAENREEM